MLSQAQRGHAKGKEEKEKAVAGLIKHLNLRNAGDSSINLNGMSISCMGSVDVGHYPPYYSTKFLFKKLLRCQIAQGLMGTSGIVYVLPGTLSHHQSVMPSPQRAFVLLSNL